MHCCTAKILGVQINLKMYVYYVIPTVDMDMYKGLICHIHSPVWSASPWQFGSILPINLVPFSAQIQLPLKQGNHCTVPITCLLFLTSVISFMLLSPPREPSLLLCTKSHQLHPPQEASDTTQYRA